ncbi:sorbosone dehydrogenase family protein [Reyranella sp. CPCC 100927]|uniref:PQQ-dependent sugar dehydrogenase n=1 Tax=Reyranella sp. CPCC 100927 TaxID=2599616 RepID=UPI0011B42DFF|nr:PQQ-dependent sugar dehydrogenase [Reyranella sp. CPCC 100927]TWT01698.1 sorbosone dehydrogenase family protein [Reyranella sp. CPCC 100927]
MRFTIARRGWVVAAAVMAGAVMPATAQQTGMSPLDLSNPAASRQDANLRSFPVPPTVTPLERLPVGKLKLPAGFKAEVWSHGHPGARTMVMGDKGTLFMGTRLIGRVYAITTKDGKRESKVLLQGLTQPNGLAFRNGALYVFAINRVFRYDNIEDKLDNPGDPVELTDKFNLPDTVHHGWKYVEFGPDGKLYVPTGVNCNICEVNPGIHGQIRRYNADGSGMEIIARGVRNTVGFDWHPASKELWFTDNGRDWAGNEGPQDELNRVAKGMDGANFGFPYCHANGIADIDIRRPNPCAGVVMPAALLGPHSAGLGIKFYTGTMFPKTYQNAAFIARRGSWNREKKFGYDVVVARTQANGTATIEPFMTGLLDEAKNEFAGRPTYVLQLKDGSLLVSDEQNGAIYRITYAAPKGGKN